MAEPNNTNSVNVDIEKGESSDSNNDSYTTELEPVLSLEMRKEFEEAGVPLSTIISHGSPDDPVMLERIGSAISIASETVGGAGAHKLDAKDANLPAFGGGKKYPPLIPYERDVFVVEYDGPDDPLHPQNFSTWKKVKIMAILAFCTFSAAWGSSIFATTVPTIAVKFHVSRVVAILSMSLYVLGFASGPLLWAPYSELSGRRKPLLMGILGFAIFNIAVARAQELQTIMICRFFAGFMGATCFAVVPATFADIFGNKWRGTAMIVFSATIFCGPLLAPVVGGFVVYGHLKWRWTEYLTGIYGWAGFLLVLFFIDETYAPQILVQKAARLRRLTGNWGIHSRQEQVEFDMKELLEKNFSRPLRMLATEPILLLMSIYTAFIYGMLYLLLEAYPIIFIELYGMSPTIGELPYLSMIVGQFIGCGIMLGFEPLTLRAIAANRGYPVPEMRLYGCMIGGIVFPIGMFWLTWAGAYHEHVHWAVPTVAGIFVGCGIIMIFLCSLTYLIEAYLMFAASAMAANTVLRSAFGAGFPIFATAMFHNLHVQWAGTLLGCIGILLAPVPFLFFKYGLKLRQMSKYTPVL
ncbi:major facilitator superfamily domain-containing protein [Lipomyces arxii]|uniref:major facilitator superfamily domain-containing protein n=1 Tax=Lipomyces arxii TaxID=56418 RepID=UPI0034CF42E7